MTSKLMSACDYHDVAVDRSSGGDVLIHKFIGGWSWISVEFAGWNRITLDDLATRNDLVQFFFGG